MPPSLRDHLLYIHPTGHLNDLVIPAGALTCMNAVHVPKAGRYAFEVGDDEILSAKVVCMDVHWALSLPGFTRLLAHVRELRPDVPVVVGGVSAGHYARDLVERMGVDYVLQGDSELAFAALIEALFAGREPGDVPNLHQRGKGPPELKRMTTAEFDATDCITADWFPTYERHSGWDAAAFPQGRTITVSRGCAFRCPECYGSYAETYGKGYLLRSPGRVVELLQQAERIGARNVRLFVAKPPSRRLGDIIRAVADAGPFHFTSAVGLYLCTAPSVEELELLSGAFENRVDISLISPDEQVPAVRPDRLEAEVARWREAARYVAGSRNLRLDLWTTARTDMQAVRLGFLDTESERVKASSGAVWSVTRPTDLGEGSVLEDVREAMAPVWTFYAGRLLSPSLARLLEPFGYLDEIDGDPLSTPCPEPRLEAYHARILESWRAHHLATLPGLAFSVLPLAGRRVARPLRQAFGANYRGAVCVVGSDAAAGLDAAKARPLVERADHKGVTLLADLAGMPSTRFLVVAPAAETPDGADGVVDSLAPEGFVAVTLPEGASARWLRIDLRVQQADLVALDEDGLVVSRGRADIGYFEPVGESAPAA